MSYLINEATHFVLPRTDIGGGKHAMVKEASYFKSQGGLDRQLNLDGMPWGDGWIPVVADGINHARLLAWMIAQGIEHPRAISFNPPNKRTVGEILDGQE